jgi:hypothetical protein
MASPVLPEWTGADPAAVAFNTAVLGGVQLPGVITVDGLECAIDVDTKKAKGSDKPTSTDNGVKPAKFELDQWINTSMWPATQVAIAQINPRRVGRERSPVQIVHPLVNLLEITNVRIISVAPKHPTARGGMHIRWRLEEWFDKPVAVKKKKEKPVEAVIADNAANLGNTHPEVLLDEAKRAALRTVQRDASHDMHDEELDPNTGKPLSPSDQDNVKNSMFVGNPNAEGS